MLTHYISLALAAQEMKSKGAKKDPDTCVGKKKKKCTKRGSSCAWDGDKCVDSLFV